MNELEGVASAELANAAVQRLLAANEGTRASALLGSALERWPDSSRLLLTGGDVLARTKGAAAAAEYYAGLLETPKLARWSSARLMAALGEGSLDLEQALKIGRAIVAGDAEIKKDVLLDLLLKRLDRNVARRFLEELAPTANVFKLEWKLAQALTEDGELEGALPILEHARACGRHSHLSDLLLSELLSSFWRLPEAIAILEQSVESQPDHPDSYRRLLALLQRAREFDRAAAVMERAVARWPNDWMLLFRLNRLPLKPANLERIFDCFALGAEESSSKDDRYRFQFALACLHQGEIDRARRLLERPFQAPVSSLAGPVLKALGARSAATWQSSSRLCDDRTKDVQVTRQSGAWGTVIVPTGIAFGNLPLALIDALFADHGLNVIFLRDFGKRAYLRGVASLGATEAETIDKLKELLSELGAERSIVMGSSSGGFSALRYGALLDADFAVSFSGPSHLKLVYRETKRAIWNPSFFIKQFLDRERDLPLDLLPALETARRTKFFQFYGASASADAWQAQRLAGLSHVTLRAVDGIVDHVVVDHMIGDGSFDALLDELASTSI